MKRKEYWPILLFCGFLFAMVMGLLLLPKRDFSETEKRYLENPPALQWDTISSGEWGEDVETYLADHIPGRNFFVGLNAYYDLLTGRQAAKDIWLKNGKLLEAPVKPDSGAIEKNMAKINAFADAVGGVDLMIIPSAGWAAGAAEYPDEAVISSIYALAKGNVTPIDVMSTFAGKPELFYNTDHHWVSAGTWEAYRAYMKAIGRDFRYAEEFEQEIQPDFRGSTYSRSALWLTPAEELELWHGSDGITVTNETEMEAHAGVFYRERLEEADKYTVFLDGNHPLVRVQNPNAKGRLLVIRDSYSNSLGCFLTESYGEVVLVDLRYYRQSVSQLLSQEAFDNILVCYSIGNFLTDTNLAWLR